MPFPLANIAINFVFIHQTLRFDFANGNHFSASRWLICRREENHLNHKSQTTAAEWNEMTLAYAAVTTDRSKTLPIEQSEPFRKHQMGTTAQPTNRPTNSLTYWHWHETNMTNKQMRQNCFPPVVGIRQPFPSPKQFLQMNHNLGQNQERKRAT